METTKYVLKDLLTIKNGKDHKALADGPYPVFGTGGVMRYAEKYLYDKVSILLPRKGTLSNIQYVDQPFWTVDTIYYTVVNEKLADPYYLFCYVNSLDLSGYDSGASIPSMTQKAYNKIKINLPDKETQKSLGEAIKAYDELIANNNNRIRLLEQMAENLYKEWFVRFRFPGYETAEFENGIPKDWGYVKLDKVLTVLYGKDHSKLEDGDVPVYGSGGIMRYGNRALYEGESVLIPRKGSLNNIMWVNCPFWTVDTMFYTKALIPNVEKYIYYVLSSLDMASYNTGAALPSMTTDILYHLKIALPSTSLLAKFDAIVSDLYEQRTLLENKNKNLIKQRGLLLPRLMSGKLEV